MRPPAFAHLSAEVDAGLLGRRDSVWHRHSPCQSLEEGDADRVGIGLREVDGGWSAASQLLSVRMHEARACVHRTANEPVDDCVCKELPRQTSVLIVAFR